MNDLYFYFDKDDRIESILLFFFEKSPLRFLHQHYLSQKLLLDSLMFLVPQASVFLRLACLGHQLFLEVPADRLDIRRSDYLEASVLV